MAGQIASSEALWKRSGIIASPIEQSCSQNQQPLDGLNDIVSCASDGIESFAQNQAQTARKLNGSIDANIPLPDIAKGERVALVFDGTLEGLATVIYTGFATHCVVEDVYTRENVQPRLGQRIVDVATSLSAALRVRRTICRNCGRNIWDALATASASEKPGIGLAVYRFCVYALRTSTVHACTCCEKRRTCTVPCDRPPRMRLLSQWTDSVVAPVLEANRYVANEAEYMKQFLRFRHTDDDLWFATCSPACNAMPFVMHHFSQRFNNQRFVIYDETRHLAGLYANGKYQFIATDRMPCPPDAAEEAQMQDAWKRFYKALTVEARYHPELRRSFMPCRLWKNITELQQAGVGTL